MNELIMIAIAFSSIFWRRNFDRRARACLHLATPVALESVQSVLYLTPRCLITSCFPSQVRKVAHNGWITIKVHS